MNFISTIIKQNKKASKKKKPIKAKPLLILYVGKDNVESTKGEVCICLPEDEEKVLKGSIEVEGEGSPFADPCLYKRVVLTEKNKSIEGILCSINVEKKLTIG